MLFAALKVPVGARKRANAAVLMATVFQQEGASFGVSLVPIKYLKASAHQAFLTHISKYFFYNFTITLSISIHKMSLKEDDSYRQACSQSI